jgi:hypothetical protein
VVFLHACKMGIEGIVSKRLTAPYRSGPSRDWIKVKNPDSPAMRRARAGEWWLTHWTPLRLSRAGCSRQFGRAWAPTMPQRVHTMRGPNVGTGPSSGHVLALKIARSWHCQHVTSSERTPFAPGLDWVRIGPNRRYPQGTA